MKRLCNLLVTFALCLGVFYGCDDQGEDNLSEPATLELLSKLVAVEADGGEQMVGFVVTNPDGSDLEGRCADDWCHSFQFPEEGVMTFVVEPNVGTSSRITNVYICYGDVEERFTLSQSGGGENPEAIAKMNFDIQYEINGPEVKMTVVPEFDNVRYYFAYSTKAEIDAIGADKIQGVIKANVQSFLQGEINALVNYSGYTFTAALDEYTGFGTRSASMTINARTDYVGWACAISNEVTVVSDVVMKEFRTGDVPPSNNVIDINIEEVNCDRVSFSISTTNEDQYAVYVLPADQVDGVSDEELVALFNTADDVTLYLQFGDYTTTRVGLEQDSDYYVLAYGYKWGMANTAIHREKFHTLSYESGTAEFSFDVQKVTNISFSGTVGCSVPTHLYYTDYCDVYTTAEDILAELEEAIDWYVNQAGYYPDRVSLMRVIGTRGTTRFNNSGDYIVPNSQYRLYAIAIDETTGDFCSEVVFSPTITTLDVADVKVSVRLDHYFDVAEVSAAYPEMGYDTIYDGYVLVPLVVEAGEDVADYYVDVFSDDLSDTSYPTDNQLFASLRDAGLHNTTPILALCTYYDDTQQPVTISSVAVNKDGNRGAVVRDVTKLTRAGCADVSLFEKYLPSASAAKCVAGEPTKREHTTRLKSLINKHLDILNE